MKTPARFHGLFRGRLNLSPALLLLVAPLLAADSGEPQARVHEALVVQVQKQGEYIALRRLAGRAVGSRRAALSAEYEGKLSARSVEVGDRVKRGQVLLALDTRIATLELTRLDANKREAAAQIGQLEADVKRQQSLKARGLASEQILDQLQSNLEASRARLAAIKVRRDITEERIAKSRIRAPFDGEVTAVNTEEGESVESGKPLIHLVEAGERELEFGVPERLQGALVIGQQLTLTGTFGQSVGIVESINQSLDTASLTSKVRVAMPDVTVSDGSIVEVDIPVPRKQSGVWLPLAALVADVRGTWVVYGLGGGPDIYTIEKRSVRPVYQIDDRVFIETAMDDGEFVVAAGIHKYAPGQQVRINGAPIIMPPLSKKAH